MKLINKALIEEGLKLESNRRAPPYNDKNQPINYDQSDIQYQEWLRRYGFLLITELLKQYEN